MNEFKNLNPEERTLKISRLREAAKEARRKGNRLIAESDRVGRLTKKGQTLWAKGNNLLEKGDALYRKSRKV